MFKEICGNLDKTNLKNNENNIVAASLASGGKIAFSVEKLKEDATDYQLYPSGRYAHSQNYIRSCLNRHGFKPLEMDSREIRKQSGHPVKGLLVVAEK